MAYSISFAPRAQRQYSRLVKQLTAPERRRLDDSIDGLKDAPRPFGCETLSGRDNRYRVPVGDYRVVYEIEDNELRVLVVIVGHRRDGYDMLRRLP
jgi:mRNA interferase RelE/StbE